LQSYGGLKSRDVKILKQNFVTYVAYLVKTKFRLALQLSLLRGSHPKYAKASPRQCAQSVPDFMQIGSLSAELSGRVNTAKSNIPLKTSFEPNKKQQQQR